uniref:Odorant receptor n=1 Tax=Glossina brevipalpis TaxID=37001 RepID=A0A1A9WSA7_9MUSC
MICGIVKTKPAKQYPVFKIVLRFIAIAAIVLLRNPIEGQIGSIEMNLWLAQIAGIAIMRLRYNKSNDIKIFTFFYTIIITIFVTFIYTACEFYDLILNWYDLNSLTQNSCLSLTHLAGLVKILNALYKLKDIEKLLDKLKFGLKTYTISNEQQQKFHDGEFETKLLLIIYTAIVATTGLLGMIILFLNPFKMAGKTFPYRAIIPSWVPLPLQLLYMSLSVFIFAMQIVAIDYLNINLINQLRCQLNILNLTFDKLCIEVEQQNCYSSSSSSNSSSSSSLMIDAKPLKSLNAAIEHHCLLKAVCQDIEGIFSATILLQFFTSLIIFAMTGFQATVQSSASNEAVLIYFYCGCIFCELFLYCFFGNAVTEQSKTLPMRGFNSSWYLYDRRYRKSLLVFLTNAQQPFVFTAGGFMDLSLPSFAGILSKSYSYIALLRQLYGR